MIEHVIRTERLSRAETPADLTSLALTRAPNYRHRDGRIYASTIGQPYVAVSVSPYNDKFESQLEDGISREVLALANLGYLPLSSCEGHHIPFSFPYVMIAFGNEQDAVEFAEHFKGVEWVSTKIATSVANVVQDGNKYQRLDQQVHNLRDEYEDLNRMYHRSYDRYWFVTVALFETFRGVTNVLRNWKTERLRNAHRQEGVDKLYQAILQLPHYLG